jgi:prephenate dehydratase
MQSIDVPAMLDNALMICAGSIHTVYDLLLRYNLHIVGEKFYNVNHCLMALPGVKRKDISRVLSHPQALAQCQDYIRELGGVKEPVDDTAGVVVLGIGNDGTHQFILWCSLHRVASVLQCDREHLQNR